MGSEIEGLDDLEADWHRTCATLESELAGGAFKAAKEGIAFAKENHPYTDRTHDLSDTAHANPLPGPDAEMVWPMPYAAFVDEGTSRSKEYPFTPGARIVAASELDHNSNAAVDAACATMNGKYG